MTNTAEQLLAWLEKVPHSLELSSRRWDDYDPPWMVHSINGGRSDQEWTLVGEGNTPLEALQDAYRNLNV